MTKKWNVRSLALLARMIGQKSGVEVVFDPRAQTASTDSKKVTLPVVRNIGSEDEAMLIVGLVDHESAHCRHTNFEMIPANQVEMIIWNTIEDVWIEREQAKAYPGCFRNIVGSMEVMTKLGWYGGPRAGTTQGVTAAFRGFLLHKLLARHYGLQDLGEFAEAWQAVLVSLLGADVVDRLWSKALEVDEVVSSAEALALARKLLDILRETAEQDAKSQTAESEEASQDDQDDRDGQADQGDKKNEAGQGASGSSGAQGDDAQPGQAGPDGNGKSPAENAQAILDGEGGSSSPGSCDRGEMIVQALMAAGAMGTTDGDCSHSMMFAAGASGSTSLKMVPRKVGLDSYHEQAKQMARPVAVKLGGKLDALLESKVVELEAYRRSGRWVSPRKLPGLKLGKPAVFRSRDEVEGINIAVQVLLDASGSMFSSHGSVTPMVMAAAPTMALLGVLELYDVPSGVATFGTGYCVIKDFHESWLSCKEFSMTQEMGGTSTDLALIRVFDQLLRREEERKLLLLVTDGCPARVDATISVLEESKRHAPHVEFAFVFIGALGRTFANELTQRGYHVATTSDPEALAQVLFEAVKNAA